MARQPGAVYENVKRFAIPDYRSRGFQIGDVEGQAFGAPTFLDERISCTIEPGRVASAKHHMRACLSQRGRASETQSR